MAGIERDCLAHGSGVGRIMAKPRKQLPKVHEDGRIHSHFALRPQVYKALAMVSERDCRSMTEQLSWLIMERKRALDDTGQVPEKLG